MVCRVKVDAPAGVVELEGEAQFVTEFFDKFLPLITEAGFGTVRPKSPSGASATLAEDALQGDSDKGKPPKARKKKRANPPAGASCRDRMLTLKADGFFKTHRSPTDIVAGLAKKGWTHNGNQVGASLTRMFEKSEIQRTSDGASFSYFWDRD